MTTQNNQSYVLVVPRSSNEGNDRFILNVPRLVLNVTPTNPEEETTDKKWLIEPADGKLLGENLDYSQVKVGFDGPVTDKIQYQAAVIRYELQGNYVWFGNGIEVVGVSRNTLLSEHGGDFKYYINLINSKTVEITIELEKQIRLKGELRFRFKAVDLTASSGDGLHAQVLVSEDPSVQPGKPVND